MNRRLIPADKKKSNAGRKPYQDIGQLKEKVQFYAILKDIETLGGIEQVRKIATSHIQELANPLTID